MDNDTVTVRIRGTKACFTRPEHRTDRLTYEIPTHSAIRGVLEAFHWKPEFYYEVQRVSFLNPVRFGTRLQNEFKFNSSGQRPASKQELTQRRTTFLVDPDYLVTARIRLTDATKDRGWGETLKHVNILRDHVRWGRVHSDIPFLGMREWFASVSLVDDEHEHVPDPSVNFTESDLGLVQFDRVDYFRLASSLGRGEKIRYLFAPHSVSHGVMEYPRYDSALKAGAIL